MGTGVGQQRTELVGHAPDRPVEKGLLAVKIGAEVHGDITPHRLAQRLRAGIGGDADVGNRIALLQALQPPDTLRRHVFSDAGGKDFCRLQRQIGTLYSHFCGEHSLLGTKYCGFPVA